MSPTCSHAALRVLVSVLLASTFANAVSFPHQVLDARTPDVAFINIPLQAEKIQAVAAASSDISDNIFDKLSDDLNTKSAFQFIIDLCYRLFGLREDAPTPSPTPTPVESSSSAVEATSSSSVVVPPGPPSTSMDVTSGSATALLSTTSVSASDMMSI